MSDALYQASGYVRRRAAIARRVSEFPCRYEVVGADGLAALPPDQWDALSSDLLEDNPYFSRAMVMAGIEAMGDAKGMKVLLVRARCDGSLAALLPFRVKGLGPMAVGQPALNLYQISGTPLIARRHAQEAISTIVRLIAEGKTLPRRWVFAHMDTNGAFMQSFARNAQAFGLTAQAPTTYERAVLTRSAGDFETHVENVIGKKRAKDVQRNLRRLAELGEVAFERATDPASVTARIEAFLKLENAGWKGARGTAFLSRPDHAAFARAAFAPGFAVVDSLLLDDVPIAISVNIGEGRTLFTPKCAFDETYRKYGPGMVLEYLVVRDFFSQDRYEEMDSSTTVDGHVIAGFWNARKIMGTIVVGPGCRRTKLLRSAISAGIAAKARIKSMLGRK
jgi:CelD/BcsL family acetyltransferase involved in cellulose biosynthesis